MYEKDITDYELPNKLSNCPHCGLILTLHPFEFRNRPYKVGQDITLPEDWHLVAIRSIEYLRYSYRILRCENEHMFIIVGSYTTTFDWGETKVWEQSRIRRFEILCDEDKLFA